MVDSEYKTNSNEIKSNLNSAPNTRTKLEPMTAENPLTEIGSLNRRSNKSDANTSGLLDTSLGYIDAIDVVLG